MRLITVKQTSEVLGVTLPRTYELARKDFFPPGVVVRLGRQIRFNEAALSAWIERGGLFASRVAEVKERVEL